MIEAAMSPPNANTLQTMILETVSNPNSKSEDFSALATLAESRGMLDTARELRARSDRVSGGPAHPKRTFPTSREDVGDDIIDDDGDDVAGQAPRREKRESLLDAVPRSAWKKFVGKMARGKRSEISPKGRLGIFQLSVRRLADLGLVSKPKKVTWKDKPGVWRATWHKLPEEAFLASPDLQYKIFRGSMERYAKQIIDDDIFKNAIGKKVGENEITLSGLLGVAHNAGLPGLTSWLKNKNIREKFPQTTKSFVATTGIF